MRTRILNLAVLIITLLFTQTVFADLKIKTKQTSGGQSYENTTYIKGKRSRSETMNGGMISITQCDLRRGVQLNASSKTYMVNPFDDVVTTKTTAAPDTKTNTGAVERGGKITSTYTIKDTGERKQMFGYTARHLIITMEMVSSPDACNKSNMKMTTDGWYIDFEAGFGCEQTYSGYNGRSGKAGGCQDKYEMKTVGTAKRGYPVLEKMTMYDESGKETLTMSNEVVELSKATLDAGLFDIPEGYREVSDAASMYNMSAISGSQDNGGSAAGRQNNASQPSSGIANSVKNAANNTGSAGQAMGPKKPGTIRIGLANVKTGSVGEGLNAADLSAAIKNSLLEYLKVPNVEVVALEARLQSAVDAEAQSKECDYVLNATVSHKKGGGGFGMFSKVIAPAVSSIGGLGGYGGTAGAVAGNVAANTIITAGTIAGNVKSKDEITLDVKLNQPSGTAILAKAYKAKAKSDGEDIISGVIEQAAQAIVGSIGKS